MARRHTLFPTQELSREWGPSEDLPSRSTGSRHPPVQATLRQGHFPDGACPVQRAVQTFSSSPRCYLCTAWQKRVPCPCNSGPQFLLPQQIFYLFKWMNVKNTKWAYPQLSSFFFPRTRVLLHMPTCKAPCFAVLCNVGAGPTGAGGSRRPPSLAVTATPTQRGRSKQANPLINRSKATNFN